ncbi:adenylate/guanylate cyclase domain-containing protein [Flagellimonas nanhaiensis]|uniref:Adenylate/guanylate cyclase domain-containing protein n=1 Tax=Flagellimonas nanhaiensis TaxID=2292706 RepID=A0A371JP25_9FLAO|nr:adenylate/guanylate cyclase domain-containing protein [Allomuricauda nanhaiensis]RDY59255.1 adenylate/guanylate cyclase domain-containing protein [Allomuricauda nanhaiensis]
MKISIINKRRWRILRFYIVGWTLACIFLSIVRGVGTEELGNLQFELRTSMVISITLGPVLGLISGLAQILAEERIYKFISIHKLLMIRFVYLIVFLILMVLSAYGIYELFFGTNVSIVDFAFDEGSGAVYFYMLSVDFFLTIARQINLMLGEGNLRKLLIGRFYTPREEERIFMFLDLKSSTPLAERLGHVEYSKLIQDCFNDLGIAITNDAEIYQYVGDEAVLTWKMEDGLRNQNCLTTFYQFKKHLEDKKSYYENKYGCQPTFKAGIHAGIVTVTEVGKYKKEIAYHGDTINTAARIQGQCNTLESELLLSEFLKAKMETDKFKFTTKGSVPLKGKKGKVSICAVHQDDISS